MQRHFIITGNIQFALGGGKVLIPIQEVSLDNSASNLLTCDPDESVLDGVAGNENWGNTDVMLVAQAWLTRRFSGDTCTLHTMAEWAAFQEANAPTSADDAALITAANALKH